jgi:hypothetical protein
VGREHDALCQKNTLRIFHDYFHKLETFNTEFITKIQFCIKNIHEKIIMYFSSIGQNIVSYIAKFQVQIPLVCGEIKERGRLDQLE